MDTAFIVLLVAALAVVGGVVAMLYWHRKNPAQANAAIESVNVQLSNALATIKTHAETIANQATVIASPPVQAVVNASPPPPGMVSSNAGGWVYVGNPTATGSGPPQPNESAIQYAIRMGVPAGRLATIHQFADVEDYLHPKAPEAAPPAPPPAPVMTGPIPVETLTPAERTAFSNAIGQHWINPGDLVSGQWGEVAAAINAGVYNHEGGEVSPAFQAALDAAIAKKAGV